MTTTIDTMTTGCGGGMLFGVFAFFASLVVLGLLAGIFWVWMLVDCANSPLPSSDKTAWILILLFTGILGAILYYFIPRRERLRSAAPFDAPPPPPPPAAS